MTENIYRIRLCSNCKNISKCTFSNDSNRPAFYCEEFEIEEMPSLNITKKDRTPPMNSHLAKNSSGFSGLCSDCENRRTCKFPRLEGGVWHCEEYM